MSQKRIVGIVLRCIPDVVVRKAPADDELFQKRVADLPGAVRELGALLAHGVPR